MRKALYYLMVIAIIVACSCKKSNVNTGISAINIINAAVNVSSFIVNFTDTAIPFYENQTFIYNGSNAEFGIPSGVSPVVIVSSDDTSHTLFQGNFNLKPGGIYSFYLAGQSPKFDTLFLQDIIPVYVDSSSGVRFINLSPDSQPISINLAGNPPSQTEFSNIGYRQISAFKTYAAGTSVGGTYNFEVRDQASGNILTTFSWNYILSKNNTIVINGLENNSTVNAFQVNNF